MGTKIDTFIRILEMGIQLKGSPTTFIDILASIEKEYPETHPEQIPALRRWVYDHFYHPETFRVNKGPTASSLPDAKD